MNKNVERHEQREGREALGTGMSRAKAVEQSRIMQRNARWAERTAAPTGWDDRVCGQEGSEVRLDSDRTHAWAASSVGDAEGLVQVQVAYIGSDEPRGSQANLEEGGGGVSMGGMKSVFDLKIQSRRKLSKVFQSIYEC